jgi:hypothetical protein
MVVKILMSIPFDKVDGGEVPYNGYPIGWEKLYHFPSGEKSSPILAILGFKDLPII